MTFLSLWAMFPLFILLVSSSLLLLMFTLSFYFVPKKDFKQRIEFKKSYLNQKHQEDVEDIVWNSNTSHCP